MKTLLFICCSFIPVFMVIFSFIGRKIKRNYLVGFRTGVSLENDVIWKKAQLIFCKLLFVVGLILSLITIPPNIYFFFFSSIDGGIYSLIIVVIQTIAVIILAIITQNKITAQS